MPNETDKYLIKRLKYSTRRMAGIPRARLRNGKG